MVVPPLSLSFVGGFSLLSLFLDGLCVSFYIDERTKHHHHNRTREEEDGATNTEKLKRRCFSSIFCGSLSLLWWLHSSFFRWFFFFVRQHTSICTHLFLPYHQQDCVFIFLSCLQSQFCFSCAGVSDHDCCDIHWHGSRNNSLEKHCTKSPSAGMTDVPILRDCLR